MPGSWCAHTCVTDGTLESGSCPSPGEFSDVGCSHGSFGASAKAAEKSKLSTCARHPRTRASPRQASRAASEAAPSPSPSPRGRRGAPEHIPSHITLSNANADLKKSIGQLRAERDGAFGERDAVLRQLKVLKQRAREHLAALHAEKQMLEEQAAAATRRLREHEEARAPRSTRS